ncbi:glycosyl hydrolase family 8 [Lichenihabitans sp. Uapishka_5]|uniref:glycosyl hydrolase family 8 n=1 Tax=Lichenihabitans sp. Uapishka_5 TaxID=3037302 RepID=UPI0029E81A74|nr:glycosyl hydrolase family 8 [Lichenihabitans sp. Uapishka_5]MDX7949578.1 glycosyl hydrolase family 8 [Lichenihabitans sp. Uapishka_5]
MKGAAILLGAILMASSSQNGARAGETLASLDAAQHTQSLVDRASQDWLSSEWRSYAARFVTPDGRVVDNANGGISHSEGQGYGMLLAVKAGDAASFETLWRWTARTLAVRKDHLLAWKWDPAVKAVTDTNNATDGDILVAWALAEAAKRFHRPDYREAAVVLARAVGSHAILPTPLGPVLKPGLTGFGASEQPDGPVVNLSYWVFPAFASLAALAPEFDWAAVRHSGLALIQASRFGTLGVPSEWEGLASGAPRPAANFPAAFGYNAIRIPLYLAFDGGADTRIALEPFAAPWGQTASTTQLLQAHEVPVTVPLAQPGYDLVMATARCVSAGTAVPPEMINARSDLYYPETLRLLSVIAIQERVSACL